MSTQRVAPCIAILILLSLSIDAAAIHGMDLGGTWHMKDFTKGMGIQKQVWSPSYNRNSFLAVQVPTTERAALLKAGEIPDPYYGSNSEKSLWTEEKEWWFCREFKVPAKLIGKYIDLVFEGIVYQGEAWLNGKPLGRMEGMFNPFVFRADELLNYGGRNYLAVRLEAPGDAAARVWKNGYVFDLPDRLQLYTIAQCLYSWDWAQHMVVTGIWRPVKLRITDAIRLDNPRVLSRIEPSGGATLDLSVETANLSSNPASFSLTGEIRPKNFPGEPVPFMKTVQLEPGAKSTESVRVTLPDARLWWPNGMGEQNLYSFSIRARNGKILSDEASGSFGVRELKIVENENTAEFLKTMKESLGETWHLGNAMGAYPWTFQVNGKKMYAKGGNWIPVDQLLRLDRARYGYLLTLARDAHYNLLRVWGGGLFETEDFYDLCDEKGILTWFEFLSNSGFSRLNREIFSAAARAVILRIRNRPSLTFYCGGNEFDPDDQGSKEIIDGLAGIIKELDPDREFHRASPYMGDDHYWGVWHRWGPYTDYRKTRPFRSEAGMNSFPVLESYKRFTPPEKLWPLDRYWVEYRGSYQTNFLHLAKQNRYANEFGEAKSIAEYIRNCLMAQALADSFNIEYCRSRKFQNSGILIWQFNDIYPCLSWSLVDWYGMPKSSYFYTKRAFRPVHITAGFERYLWKPGEIFQAEVSILNDTDTVLENLQYETWLLDAAGTVLDKRTGTATVPANVSQSVLPLEWTIPDSFENRVLFLAVKLKDVRNQLLSDTVYPIAVKTVIPPPAPTPEQAADRNFNKYPHYEGIFADLANIPPVKPVLRLSSASPAADPDGYHTLEITVGNPSPNFLFDARIAIDQETEGLTVFYSDNYLSLLPGEQKSVTVRIGNKGGMAPVRSTTVRLSGWNCDEIQASLTLK